MIPSHSEDYIGENMYIYRQLPKYLVVPGQFNVSAVVGTWFSEYRKFDGDVYQYTLPASGAVIKNLYRLLGRKPRTVFWNV